MKPLFIALAMLATVVTKSSFASDIKVTDAVLHSFARTFNSAHDVNWSRVNTLYKAEFVIDGQVVSAFYEDDGALIATARFIRSAQLPISLQTSLKEAVKENKMIELFELNNEDGTTYYATYESGDKKIHLRSVSSTDWVAYKKSK